MLPQTRSSSNHAVEKTFRPDGVKPFKYIQHLNLVVFPQTQPSSFHGDKKPYRLDVMQPFQKHSSWRLGCVPQHSLSQNSSFCGVQQSCRLDVMQIINNVQMNGWSCSPKHGPAHITASKQFFVRMIWSFSKTCKSMAGPCFPKHGPVPFTMLTMLKNLFLWMLSSHLKTFKLMPGPRSPTFFVTAQLISRRRKNFSFWCNADFQQRSNERLVVLLQTRSSSIHGVESTFCPNGVKLFKNIQNLGWVVSMR